MIVANESARLARRLLALPLMGTAMLAAIGYLPTRTLAGASGVQGMLAGQGIVMAVVYATLVPAMQRMVGADGGARLRIGLRAAVIRLFLTILVSGAVAWRRLIDPTAFLVWIGIAYVVMIKIETLVLIYWNKRLGN